MSYLLSVSRCIPSYDGSGGRTIRFAVVSSRMIELAAGMQAESHRFLGGTRVNYPAMMLHVPGYRRDGRSFFFIVDVGACPIIFTLIVYSV